MSDIVDYTEVPYLQEILNYLPIQPEDEEDINSYIQNILNLVAVNYKYEQYQFAYFGIHLLYMTYIYCTIWKISQIEPDRYKDAIIYARPYSGKDKEFKIDEPESVFVYSLMPESDIAKIFRIINLDNSQITSVGEYVKTRNEMAHASGKFEIPNEESFDTKVHALYISIKNIHNKMDTCIRKWYEQVLLSFCKGEYEGYENPKDVILELMIQSFKLSVNELLVCNEMSIGSLITAHTGYQAKLRDFKKAVFDYCQEMGYIYTY